MIELKGFYKQETLEELLFKGNISHLEYIYHHSQEMKDSFKIFCSQNKVEENENSAQLYFEYRLKEEENSHTDMLD